ncbi:hypothetical protein [Roseibium sp. Sym1]|uniref:hypothetical protein n=1 Tax=Roseibium sp. Sym1 TaxID=3016006 RepID=UPI0022B47D01|nr:hypothetical protein [Roseibium sp. Sym1]
MPKLFLRLVLLTPLMCLLPAGPSLAVTDVYDFCDTRQDYKKILKYYKNYRDPSDQMIDYMRKRLPKGKSALKLSKQEFKDLSKGFKPAPVNPPKTACQKIPGNKLVIDKSGPFTDMTCVRPPSWTSCKWIDKRALKSRWKLSADRKYWTRR